MIDVQVVAYNDEEQIRACLESVANEPSVASITVVDHLANLPPTLNGIEAAIIADRTNPGFGAGQNCATEKGEADLILLLNPDAHMVPGALEAGSLALLGAANVAAVQGLVTGSTTGAAERSHGRELGPAHLWGRALGLSGLLRIPLARSVGRRTFLRDHVDRKVAAPVLVESLAATAVLIRRSALEEVGGFDERYFLYGEDLDLCRRLRSAGWLLMAIPVPWAIHVSGGSAESWVSRERHWWAGTLQFAAKWWSSPRYGLALGAAACRAATLGRRSGAGLRIEWSMMSARARDVRRTTAVS
ncbi:MAG: glycosyltransferase family 2 protein [Acidimicrobiales bacterium]